MNWKDIMKKELRNFNEFFNEFVEALTDDFIEREIEDYSDNKDDEEIQQNRKNLETALKEVLYDDLFNNIARFS